MARAGNRVRAGNRAQRLGSFRYAEEALLVAVAAILLCTAVATRQFQRGEACAAGLEGPVPAGAALVQGSQAGGAAEADVVGADAASDAAEADASGADGGSGLAAGSAVAPGATANVGALLQNPELPAGCEAVSLTIVLEAMGYRLGLTEIVDSYLATDPSGGNYVYAFRGDPRVSGEAFPPAIVDAANAYLLAHGAAETAQELTGSSFAVLQNLVQDGVPVIVWTALPGEFPEFSGVSYNGYAWYNNEHCVVLYGLDGTEVLVSDPLEGLVRRNADEFQTLYEMCGAMAVALY